MSIPPDTRLNFQSISRSYQLCLYMYNYTCIYRSMMLFLLPSFLQAASEHVGRWRVVDEVVAGRPRRPGPLLDEHQPVAQRTVRLALLSLIGHGYVSSSSIPSAETTRPSINQDPPARAARSAPAPGGYLAAAPPAPPPHARSCRSAPPRPASGSCCRGRRRPAPLAPAPAPP